MKREAIVWMFVRKFIESIRRTRENQVYVCGQGAVSEEPLKIILMKYRILEIQGEARIFLLLDHALGDYGPSKTGTH